MNMLLGGSHADGPRTFTHGFFAEGTKATQFKASGNYFLRFLPAFDEDKKGTPDYESSYVPYRSNELPEDWKTKTPGFTSWFFVVQGYTFYGKSNQTLLSPLSTVHGNQSKLGKDPISDIRKFCEKSDDPTIRALTEDKSFKERAPAPSTRYFVLCNVLLMTDVNSKRTENQVGVFTNAAWNDLKVKMAMRAGRNDEVISKSWEDFLYGDVTNPSEGLAATVRETSADSAENIRFAGAHFSDSPGRLDGHQKWDLSDKPEALTNRYMIGDPSVTRIWTYDEVLDYVVKDGVIPYSVVEQACSAYAENGIPTPSATSVGPTHSIPNQIADTDKEEISSASTVTPAVEKVAETTAPTPKPVAAAVEVTQADASHNDAPERSEAAENSDVSAEDRARYEELAEKFRTAPHSLPHDQLPEFFDLCARLGVSPGGN